MAEPAPATPKEKPVPSKAAGFMPRVMKGLEAAKPLAKVGGALALAGLGYAAGRKIHQELTGNTPESLMNRAISDIQNNRRQAELAGDAANAMAQSYQASIEQNLQTVRQNAPDLYMAVASGRRLPQGAVVIGGEQRQDLLNELGRAMADGRFSR